MKYVKNVKIHNIKLRVKTNSPFIAALISDQLDLGAFNSGRKKAISVSLDLEEVKDFPHGRSDGFEANGNNLGLECWLRHIAVKVDPVRNSIVGKVRSPALLSREAILDLLIIHPLRHVLKYKGIFMAHAATVAKNGRGILVCGPFGSGKSTLAVKLVEDGFRFLSDEFVMFNGKSLLSLPLKIGLDENSIRVFPKIKKRIKKAGAGYEKLSFDIRRYYPGCWAKSCAPKVTIFLKKQKRPGKTVIRPIDRVTAFLMLCKDKDNTLLFEENLAVRQKQIQALAGIAEKTDSYVMQYSLDKTGEASKAVSRLLAGPSS